MDKADDYVSLVIAIIAVIYSFATILKSIYGAKKPMPRRTGHQSEDVEKDVEDVEEEETFEEFVRQTQASKQELGKKAVAFPPPPQQVGSKASSEKEFSFHSQLDAFAPKTDIDDRHLTIHLRPGSEICSDAFRLAQSEGAVMKRPTKPSIQQLIKSLPQEKLLLISYEVFHVPVSKRSCPFPWNG